MGVEGRVALLDDAAQQQQQEADGHADGQQAVQLEPALAGVAALQAGAQAVDAAASSALSDGGRRQSYCCR